jgi:hypothetical protein
MLQIRPTEIKAVADLLTQEHDDVDTLAKAVIELLDGLRAKRELFVLVEIHPSIKVAKALGPYATRGQAEKDIKLMASYDTHSRGYLCNLKDPTMISGAG